MAKQQHTEEWASVSEISKLSGCPDAAIRRMRLKNIIETQWDGHKFLYRRSDVPKIREVFFDPEKRSKAAKSWDHSKSKKRKEAEKTLAVCPRCGKKHLSSRTWIGRGTPRFYCNDCQKSIEGRSSAWQNMAVF